MEAESKDFFDCTSQKWVNGKGESFSSCESRSKEFQFKIFF